MESDTKNTVETSNTLANAISENLHFGERINHDVINLHPEEQEDLSRNGDEVDETVEVIVNSNTPFLKQSILL